MSPKETQTPAWVLSSPKANREPVKAASFGAQSNHEEDSDTPQFGVKSSVQKDAQSKPLDARSSSYPIGEPSRQTVDNRNTRTAGVIGQFEDPPSESGKGAMTLGREEVAPMDTDHGKLGFQERARRASNSTCGSLS